MKTKEEVSTELIEKVKKLQIVHTTWKDYALILLNSTPDPLRSIWREKVVGSITHWEFASGSISEGNMAAIEILEALPNDLTKMVVDDWFNPGSWNKENRLSGSKRMNVFIGRYPQESLSNEANLCLKYIVENWKEYGHLIGETPILKSIWELAQESGGKCPLPDEVLTYILEKPIDDKKAASWIDVARDLFTNGIPSDKYAEYYHIEKIEGFPIAEYIPSSREWYIRQQNSDGTWGHIAEVTFEKQKKNFLDVCDIFFKEDVSFSPCWKKICICILKNDTTFKYAGFAPTLRERLAREDAIAAFSTKQEEQVKAKKEAEKLAEQMKKEKEKEMAYSNA